MSVPLRRVTDDGARMSRQASAYEKYLEALATHLLSPSETSEAPILSAARNWDSNTRGMSPNTGLTSKVPRLLKALAANDKIAWANLILGVDEECSQEIHRALKDISPFKGKLIMCVSDWNGQSCDIDRILAQTPWIRLLAPNCERRSPCGCIAHRSISSRTIDRATRRQPRVPCCSLLMPGRRSVLPYPLRFA